MPFVSHPRLPGKVYVPEELQVKPKKHPCKDCFSCQLCGDDRCQVCCGETVTDAVPSKQETENSVNSCLIDKGDDSVKQ